MSSLFQHILQLWRRLFSAAHGRRFEREMEEEMRFHLDMQIEQNLEAGMALDEARYAAERQFGNQTWLKEVSREMWSLNSIETVIQDLRYGARMLLKAPNITLIAVLTLAIGIGANTAMFSAVDAVLIRPLPYLDADSLVMVWDDARRTDTAKFYSTPAEWQEWRRQNSVFTDIAATQPGNLTISSDGEPEELQGRKVTANLWTVLGAKPLLGRIFTEDEDTRGERVAVINYALWQR